jgi:hypothetical protein
VRGAVLGGLYAIAIGICFAVGSEAVEISRYEDSLLLVMVVWSLPVAIGLTIVAAGAAKQVAKMSPLLRAAAYLMLSLFTMTVATPFWIAVIPPALVATAVFAIVFELWFVRPYLAPQRGLRSRDPTRAAIEKGALLGASTGLGIALAHAFSGQASRYCGLLDCPWFVDPGPSGSQLFAAVAMHAVPIAILWGCFVGWVAHVSRESRWRSIAVVVAAFTGLWIFSIAWPELLEDGLGVGLVHCALLLSWTRGEPRAEAPVAILIDRLRSTCSADARSRGPRRTPSDTSRTTRSA